MCGVALFLRNHDGWVAGSHLAGGPRFCSSFCECFVLMDNMMIGAAALRCCLVLHLAALAPPASARARLCLLRPPPPTCHGSLCSSGVAHAAAPWPAALAGRGLELRGPCRCHAAPPPPSCLLSFHGGAPLAGSLPPLASTPLCSVWAPRASAPGLLPGSPIKQRRRPLAASAALLLATASARSAVGHCSFQGS